MLFAFDSYFIRRTPAIRDGLLPMARVLRVGIQLDLAPAMAEKPAARVVGLIHGDPVDPRLERASAAEASDIAKNLEEDFLYHVGRLGGIAEKPDGQIINGLLEPVEQFLVRAFGAFAERFGKTQIVVFRDRIGDSIRTQVHNGSGHR